jgi:choline dehydrogenase
MNLFDYIVIGAGTAGCVVATRLAAGGRRRVLVLEAGGTDRRFWVQLPIGYGRTFNDPRVNWMYESEPDPTLAGRPAFWPRGKVVGGSGSINALVYYRGLPRDFDAWRDLGNPGWGFEDVRQVFERFEAREDAPRSSGGPTIHITDVSPDVHPLCESFLESGRSVGLPRTDFNGPDGEGLGLYQIMTRGGRRESTARSYLHPALLRRQLTLLMQAQVLRILFEENRATGIIYQRDGRTRMALASKGIMLCAGAINSPQLLQLSGIGDSKLLRSYGIEVVADRPAVGRNLHDHLAVSYFYRSKVPTLNSVYRSFPGKAGAALKYLFTRRGPLAMSVNQAGGFVRSDAGRAEPNLQLYFNPVSYTTSSQQRRVLEPDPFPAFLLSFNACRPTSRGYVEIRSANAFDAPAIVANALATEEDRQDALAGIRLLRDIAGCAPLSKFIESEMLPGSSRQTDEELLEDFRERASTVFHPVSTCRMGPDPADSVVDASLKVHGVEGLRVIDASVFPMITSGNINAPTIMVAEKGAAIAAAEEDA